MPRVLVAEDEKDLQFLYRAWLGREGYDVVTADDGAEAVETYESQPFDAVMLDVKMPRMDGVEACRRIRMKHPDVPILMVSVMARPDDVARGLAAGANAYATKPVTPREVKLRLSEIIPS